MPHQVMTHNQTYMTLNSESNQIRVTFGSDSNSWELDFASMFFILMAKWPVEFLPFLNQAKNIQRAFLVKIWKMS